MEQSVFNNAGHGGGGPVEEVSLELIRETFDTNVFGLIRMCQLVLPGMRARRSGVIVNLGSAAGLVTPPTGCPYTMSEFRWSRSVMRSDWRSRRSASA